MRQQASHLRGLRILVAEDDRNIADLLQQTLFLFDIHVIGPFSSLGEVVQAIRGTPDIDGAMLDVQVRGGTIDPVAEALAERGVPFILLTGHRRLHALSESLGDAPLLTKPFTVAQLEDVMRRVFRPGKGPEQHRVGSPIPLHGGDRSGSAP